MRLRASPRLFPREEGMAGRPAFANKAEHRRGAGNNARRRKTVSVVGRSHGLPAAPGIPPQLAAAFIGMFAFRKLRTLLIMRCLSSSGSRHGKTVMSEFGASEATSIEVCSGCDGVSSGNTRIGVWQFLIKSRETLYRKSGWARHRLWHYLSIGPCATS